MQEVVGFHALGHGHLGLFDVALELAQWRQAVGHGFDEGGFQNCRHMVVEIEELLLGIAGIAGEDFVSTVASQQQALAVLTGSFGAEVGRDGGSIAKGFIVGTCGQGYGVQHILGSDIVLVQLGAKVVRGGPGIFHFIETLGIEADSVSINAVRL